MNATIVRPASVRVAASAPSPVRHIFRGGDRTVIWLHGDQDLATEPALRNALAGEVAVNGADLVVDLRDVTFIDAATLTALVGARNTLLLGQRSLTLRSSPKCARRLLEVCGLSDLLAAPAVDAIPPSRDT